MSVGTAKKDVAANICVPAESFTNRASQGTLAHLNANTVCHVKILCQKTTWQCKFLSQPFLVVEIFTVTPDNSLGFAASVSSFDEVLSGNREKSSRKNFYCHYNLLFLTTPMPCVLRTLPVAALNHLRWGESILPLPQPASLSDVEITLRNLVQSTRALPLEKTGMKTGIGWSWPVSPDVWFKRRMLAAPSVRPSSKAIDFARKGSLGYSLRASGAGQTSSGCEGCVHQFCCLQIRSPNGTIASFVSVGFTRPQVDGG